jgi:frataxin
MIGNRLIRSGLLLRPLAPAALARTTATATATTNVTRITTALTDTSNTTRRRFLFTGTTSISNTSTIASPSPSPSTYSNINININHRSFSGCSQFFDNESEFHTVADETLEDIQDAVDVALEEYYTENENNDDNDDEFETVYASGVLNMTFPPHGTWVLNKQTPNRQIWWSSPISGPRRYEYDENISEWMYTRANNNDNDTTTGGGDSETLTNAIKDEIRQIYGIELDLK